MILIEWFRFVKQHVGLDNFKAIVGGLLLFVLLSTPVTIGLIKVMIVLTSGYALITMPVVKRKVAWFNEQVLEALQHMKNTPPEVDEDVPTDSPDLH